MNFRSGQIWLTILMLALFLSGCAAEATPAAVVAPIVEPTATTAAPAQEPAAPQPTATSTSEAVEEKAQEAALRFEVVAGQSEARYRVREQLANLTLPNDAVGVTQQISGSVAVLPDGTIEPGSQFVVDMSSLQSDSSRRDNYVRRNVLQTDQFPQATFVPTRVSGVSFPLPVSGEVSFELTGDLTIRDVTREVTWLVSGNIDGQQASGLAIVRFTFADFNLTKPNVASVLSIEDQIDLEIDIAIQSAGGG
jgi:polyisoprenoid-binding protein YceI